MNCPGCGRFMTLELNERGGLEECAYLWECSRPADCTSTAIPAPEYDWRYWGVPGQELKKLRVEEPETAAAFDLMKARYVGRRTLVC